MFKCMSPGAIGIRGLSLPEAIDLAKQAGFEGVDFSVREAAELVKAEGLAYVQDLFAAAGVRPGHWGLPVAWNQEDQWQNDLAELPALARVARDLGCTRTATWCPSGSNTRERAENWTWHVERFGAIARVLKDAGCSLGIEFIGPKTFRSQFAYPFVYTLGEIMEMAAAIGTGNVGLLLDAWHLYTSGGAIDDLDAITADDVIVVHVNDAPAGVDRDAQVDQVRCLPMETGVIDLGGFMRKLVAMDYVGPVTPEPFSQRVNELAAADPLAAARLVADAMDALWQAGGLR